MHDGAVHGGEEIRAAPFNLLQQGQAAAAGAGLRAQRAHVAGGVADERVVLRGQVGDDDVARGPWRQRLALAIDDFHDDVFGRDVHAAVRAFVGDEARVAPAVAVGDGAAEGGGDLRALRVVQALGRDERHFHAQAVERQVARAGVAGDAAQGRRVAEQHARTPAAQLPHVTVEARRRHGKRGQQHGAQQRIAQAAHAVLRLQLDGRTPQDGFAVADVDAPPARGAPLGGDVVADAAPAQEEPQRFAAGAARGERAQTHGARRLETVARAGDIAFAQQRQARQVGQLPYLFRVEAATGK